MATDKDIEKAVISVFSDTEYNVSFIRTFTYSCTINTKDKSKCLHLFFHKLY